MERWCPVQAGFEKQKENASKASLQEAAGTQLNGLRVVCREIVKIPLYFIAISKKDVYSSSLINIFNWVKFPRH